MPRDYRLYLDDMLEAAALIRSYIRGIEFPAFQSDRKTIDAVVRNLEVIGEAARVLPDDVKSKAPEIEWRKVVALRNLLVHQYVGVSPAIVWEVASQKIPDLERACKRLLEQSEPPPRT